ncbi:sensor histidine kinase [Streptomyces sp. NPDC050504]|uniref:sensor histidine kinase n=1 Tax=Streptomyces sp. NPDC050504 TaxID=3365618 RepID=UPI0037BAA725
MDHGEGGKRKGRARTGSFARVVREDLLTTRWLPLPPLPGPRVLSRIPHIVIGWLCIPLLLALVDGLVMQYGVDPEFAWVLGLGQTGAVVLTMFRAPLGFWVGTGTALVTFLATRPPLNPLELNPSAPDPVQEWPWPTQSLLSMIGIMFLLALRVRLKASVVALGVTVLLTALTFAVQRGPYVDNSAAALIAFAVAVTVGAALNGRRQARTQLAEQTTLTEAERARATLLEERSRIARELHDVVAHHMSVISIQAQVAPHLVQDPPRELRENLQGIRENALEALTELRRVLGVLRSEDPDSPTTPTQAPQPTLDDLPALVANVRGAGLDVTTATRGEARPLPQGVELSAYRIVQEALSNTLRHAPGARATVAVEYAGRALRLRVANTPPTAPAPPSPGAGHGLLGMRERAVMLGGELAAGPTPDGGYEVTAFLPTETTTP